MAMIEIRTFNQMIIDIIIKLNRLRTWPTPLLDIVIYQRVCIKNLVPLFC